MLCTFSEQLPPPPPAISGTSKLQHPYQQAMLWPYQEQKEKKKKQLIMIREQHDNYYKQLEKNKKKEKEKKKNTNFCSTKKLVQATKFFVSRPLFPASPSKTYFCINPAAPHRNVFSLASSRIPNSSCDDIWNLGGRAWITPCKDSDISHAWI
jgi:hypothetical protein